MAENCVNNVQQISNRGKVKHKTLIHINQHIIRKNKKTGNRDPVITCKTYKSNQYAKNAIIYDKEGNEVARVVYNPDKPLSCGAVCWIEVQGKVVIE